MINLLPPPVKEDYRYGLRNTLLRRWALACVAAILGLGLLTTYGLLLLQNSTHTYEKQVNTTQAQLEQQDLKGTEAHVKELSGDFKLVVQVLSKEVLFSKLLKQIATVIPSQAVLTGLTINQTSGGIDITAAATDYETATQVQVNLQDPANKVFSKADIVSINCTANGASDAYPCKIQLRALFSNNNPYLFVNTKAGP